jgi:hypothetical protein
MPGARCKTNDFSKDTLFLQGEMHCAENGVQEVGSGAGLEIKEWVILRAVQDDVRAQKGVVSDLLLVYSPNPSRKKVRQVMLLMLRMR